jgi:hypothetical protein
VLQRDSEALSLEGLWRYRTSTTWSAKPRQKLPALVRITQSFSVRPTCANLLVTGVYGVSKMLGLYQPPESYWFSDNMTRSATKQLTPSPAAVSDILAHLASYACMSFCSWGQGHMPTSSLQHVAWSRVNM